VEYSDYKRHLEVHHRLKFLECDPNGEARGAYNIDIKRVETCVWPQYCVEVFDQVFFIRLHYLNHFSIGVGFSSSLNIWVSLFGPGSESNKYTASIEMCPRASGSPDGGPKWTRECRVNNFRDEAIQVIKGVGALSIHVGEISLKCGANFLENSGSEWLFRIVVHKASSQDPGNRRIPVNLSPVTFPTVPSPFSLPATLMPASLDQEEDDKLDIES